MNDTDPLACVERALASATTAVLLQNTALWASVVGDRSPRRQALLLLVLARMHTVLKARRTAPAAHVALRGLYYEVAAVAGGDSSAVDVAVKDASVVTGIPRHALGVTPAARGLAAGGLTVPFAAGAVWHIPGAFAALGDFLGMEAAAAPAERSVWAARDVDLSAWVGDGYLQPPDPTAVAAYEAFLRASPADVLPRSVRCEARWLLVVEKQCALQRLLDAGILAQAPVALVTGCGLPDHATTAFVAFVARLFPALAVVGIADPNPYGALVLSQYRHGRSTARGLSAVSTPRLRWAGVHAPDLEACLAAAPFAAQALSKRDVAVGSRLSEVLRGRGNGEWADAVTALLRMGRKADMEALEGSNPGALARLVVRALLSAPD